MNRRIPLFQPAVQNVDEIQLKTFAARLVDGYIDEAEFINRRPGCLRKYDTQLSEVTDAVYWWAEKDKTYAIADDSFFEAGVISLGLGSFVAETLTRRPTFVPTKLSGRDVLFINHGTKIYYYDPDVPVGDEFVNLTDLDADITWESLQIATLDSYMLSIEESGVIHFSNVLDPSDWDGDFVSAEESPDDLSAIHVVGDIVYAFGQRSVERYYNDGSTPFVRYRGARVSSGTYSPDTIQVVGQSLIYLNQNRRLTILSDGSPRVIPAPFDKTIQSFEYDTADAYADVVEIAGKTFYVLSFPSFARTDYDGSSKTGITFVYDYTLDRWYEWGEWDAGNSEYGPFMMTGHTYVATEARHLISSSKNDGWIYEMRTDLYTDIDGTPTIIPIRTLINSGYFDHGTLQRKQVNRFMCRLKKGYVDETHDGVIVTIRYRDENSADYGNTITIDMGDAEDIEFYVKEGPFGQYRARQYEVASISQTPFIMGAVEEDITVLDQ